VSIIRIFACEPQPVVIEGLMRVFAAHADVEFAGAAASIGEGLAGLRTAIPEVALLDDGDGIKSILEQLPDLKKAVSRTALVVFPLTVTENESYRAVQRGATGVVRKTAGIDSLLECIRTVARGEIWMEYGHWQAAPEQFERRILPRLTAREREIVHYVHRGFRNRDIAEALTITPGTVKVHLMHIFEKTGVKDRFELAVLAHRLLATGEAARLRDGQALLAAEPGA
jgi:two-component system nitrate/nitrite response regulator NarL